MNVQTSLLRQLENQRLNSNQRAELRCQAARQYEDMGEYESAREVMGELWQRIGERPKVEGLEQSTAAEVLLRAGVVTGWIGSTQQITDSQETAKNLLSQSISIFESLGYERKVLEAQTEIAYCYWRTGAYDEARIHLQGVLARITTNNNLKAKAILRLGIVESDAGRHSDALPILTDAAPLFQKINSHVLKGSYHNQLAIIFKTLAAKEQKEDYIDRAFVEYEAASFHFEEAKHKRYLSHVENNLGFLFYRASKYKEAHRHLDRARRLAESLKDRMHTARIDETRARVFLAQNRNSEAEKAAKASASALEAGGHQALLAEALITRGKALARLAHYEQARFTLLRAIEISEQAGAMSRAGEAALVIVRELGGRFEELQTLSTGLPLLKELRRYEHDLIKQALINTGGIVTNAARLLQTSHQHLSYIIEHRHKDLIKFRTEKRERPKRK
jgi:tetratricopeptide (TPR) repeat protein